MTFCQVASSAQGDANKQNKMNGLEHGLPSWSFLWDLLLPCDITCFCLLIDANTCMSEFFRVGSFTLPFYI